MPIQLSLIPEHVAVFIAQKLELRDYVNFQKTSRKACEIAKILGKNYLCNANSLYFQQEKNVEDFTLYLGGVGYSTTTQTLKNMGMRIKAKYTVIQYDDDITMQTCERVRRFFSFTNSLSESLHFSRDVQCPPEKFNDLLEASKVKEIVNYYKIPSDCLRIPAIQKLEHIRFKSTLIDDDILNLNVPHIEVHETRISSNGVHKLLKLWLDGKRNFTDVVITTFEDIEEETIFSSITYYPDRTPNSPQKCYFVDKNDGTRLVVTTYVTDYRRQNGVSIRALPSIPKGILERMG